MTPKGEHVQEGGGRGIASRDRRGCYKAFLKGWDCCGDRELVVPFLKARYTLVTFGKYRFFLPDLCIPNRDILGKRLADKIGDSVR